MPFPITAAVPAYHVEVHALDRHTNLFYVGNTITLSFTENLANNAGNPATKAFTGNYYVRDYYGTLVASGSASAATSVTLSALPCGWYKVFLTQATNDATYGTAAGSGTFSVMPVDSRFMSMAGEPVDSIHPAQLSNMIRARAAFVEGPGRYSFATINSFAADLATVQSCLRSEALWYGNPSFQDAARPRRQFILFTDGYNNPTNVTSIVSTLCGEFGAGAFWFEGPGNEPNGSAATNATRMQAFYNAVKAADPNAFVIGPCPVSINGTLNAGTGSYVDNFLTNVTAMNPLPLDGFSFHLYNSNNGDLSLGHRCLSVLRDTLASHGLEDLPLFQTEQSQKTTENGVLMPRMAARWDVQQFLLLDQYGVPKEQSHLWYDGAHGFWAVPNFWSTDETLHFAAITQLGIFSREVYGKTFLTGIDFGDPGNDMMLGNRYMSAVDGDVFVFQSAGQTDAELELSVAGATALTIVDCFGNTSSATVTAGIVTVAVTVDPVYVRVPATATVAVLPWRSEGTLGVSFAPTATLNSSGGSTNKTANLARVANGTQDTAYWNSVTSTRNNVDSPYFDDTGSYPAWLSLTWAAPVVIDHVIVFAAPLWQKQGTLLDFDVQTWDGVDWVTQETFTTDATFSTVDDPDAVLFSFVDNERQGGCTVMSFFPERWIFEAVFAPVSTTALRLWIRDATYGMDPTVEALNAQFGDKTDFSNNFVIREVQAYSSALGVPRLVVNPA